MNSDRFFNLSPNMGEHICLLQTLNGFFWWQIVRCDPWKSTFFMARPAPWSPIFSLPIWPTEGQGTERQMDAAFRMDATFFPFWHGLTAGPTMILDGTCTQYPHCETDIFPRSAKPQNFSIICMYLTTHLGTVIFGDLPLNRDFTGISVALETTLLTNVLLNSGIFGSPKKPKGSNRHRLTGLPIPFLWIHQHDMSEFFRGHEINIFGSLRFPVSKPQMPPRPPRKIRAIEKKTMDPLVGVGGRLGPDDFRQKTSEKKARSPVDPSELRCQGWTYRRVRWVHGSSVHFDPRNFRQSMSTVSKEEVL